MVSIFLNLSEVSRNYNINNNLIVKSFDLDGNDMQHPELDSLFIMDSVTSPGDALESFRKYLAKQGKSIKSGVEENEDSYSVVSLCVVTETMSFGNEIIYLPKIKMYAIDFDRANYQFSTSCGKYEEVDISLNYQEVTSLFDYKALCMGDSELKTAFDNFINGTRKKNIEDANTYFNGIFAMKG